MIPKSIIPKMTVRTKTDLWELIADLGIIREVLKTAKKDRNELDYNSQKE